MILKKIFLIALLFVPLAHAEEAENECESALVEHYEGEANQLMEDGTRAAIEIGQTLDQGEKVSTGPDSWIDLRLCDGSAMRVGENSELTLEEAQGEGESLWSWAFNLAKGSVLAVVQGEGKSGRVKLRVRTTTASLGVRGTEFAVDLDEKENTSLHTLEGEVLMGRPDQWEDLQGRPAAQRLASFEKVGREHTSRIGRGERRASRAAAFQVNDWKAKRGLLFRRALARANNQEARKKIRDARKLRGKKRRKGLLLNKRKKRWEK